jgi:hypothetical protein
MIDQLPKIPDDGYIPPKQGVEQVAEQITLNDLPPPGAILQRKLTEREIIALKGFGNDGLKLLNEIAKDMLPGIGEARAMAYAEDEIRLLNKAVEERDVPGTIVHGIGVPLMSAGTLPYWLGGAAIGGTAAFLMRDVIGKGYRRFTSRFRKPLEDPISNNAFMSNAQAFARTEDNILIRQAYSQWLRGLPENRIQNTQTSIANNMLEFNTTIRNNPDRLNRLIDEDMADINYTASRIDNDINIKLQKELLNKEKQKAELIIRQKNLPDKTTEILNYGETATPKRTGLAKNVSEFQGSRAFDVLAKENFKGMNTKQIQARIINLIRTGKIPKEEIFDAGILKLDENFKPIGGALGSKDLQDLKGTVDKQVLLKMLKNAPSQRLSINTYGTVQKDADFFDLYASTDIIGANIKGNIDELIFKTTNTADRRTLRNVRNTLDDLMYQSGRIAEGGNVVNFASDRVIQQLQDIIPELDVATQQMMRAYVGNIEKIKPYTTKLSSKFDQREGYPMHQSTSTAGGADYREKVIYLDEPIPLNKGKGVASFTSHFKEGNPIVHVRYKTRYTKDGDPVFSIEEIQSDTLQPFYDSGGKIKREAMNNPYDKGLLEGVIRKKMRDLIDEQRPLIELSKKQPLSNSQKKLLQKLQDEQSLLKKYFVKSEAMDEAALQKIGKIIKDEVKEDYYPYMRSYYKLALRSLIDEAVRDGRRGITIVPVGKGTHHSKDKGHYLYYGDNKGSKIQALEFTALPPAGKIKRTSAEAIYPATLRQIAKEIEKDYGIKLNLKTQKIYNTSDASPYVIKREGSDSIVAAFKNKKNRDYMLEKYNTRGSASFVADDLTIDPSKRTEVFTGFTLEIPDNAAKILSKKKLRSYVSGGLVAIEPKREYFAPLF